MGFVHKTQKKKEYWNIEVQIAGDSEFHFINEQMVLDKVESMNGQIIGLSLEELSLQDIRKGISELHAVKNVEVASTIDGQLRIRLAQRTPILRVLFADGSSLYIDKEAQAMPLAPHYTAHVPVFTGAFGGTAERVLDEDPLLESSEDLKGCYEIVLAIQKNTWMQAQTEHFALDSMGNFVLIPRVGNHKVVLGKPNKLDRKFKKLQAFYENTIGSKDLNKYTVINLKYRDQVVCTKRPW